VDVVRALVEAGGVADASHLTRATSRHRLATALAAGEVVRVARGRYAIPTTDEDARAAAAVGGALDLVSAALRHGWPVKTRPTRPQVLVPRGRNVPALHRRTAAVRWGTVTDGELTAGVVSPVRTVLDSARFLPLDEALSIADSALRAGMSRSTLLFAAARLPRTGRARAYRVVELADARAANPFESVVRAVLLDVPGTSFEPQVWVANVGRADLVDRRLRLVVEADSFEFHGTPAALHRDMVRYNAFVAADQAVLRFGWRHAMFEQDYVRATVSAVAVARGRSVRACRHCSAA
jgi:hypothetical protein